MFADSCRDEASTGSLEQLAANALLEIGELVAESRLREMEMLPGSSQVAELRNRGNEPQVANLETNHVWRWVEEERLSQS